jgi:integrase
VIKGTLIWLEKSHQWAWRGPVVIDGVRVPKKQFMLGTDSKVIARAKAAELLKGMAPEEVAAATVETFVQAARRIVVLQATRGTKDAIPTGRLLKGETCPEDTAPRMRRFRKWVFPLIGHLRVDRIKPPHIEEVLDAVTAAGKSRSTVDHIRDDMSSILRMLWKYGIITSNPCTPVEIPASAKRDKRKRIRPTIDEINRMLASSKVRLETHVAVVCSARVGGQRASDLLGADYGQIDTQTWSTWRVYRPKTESWAVHKLDPVAAQVLQVWWNVHNRPLTGPVFPVTKGKRKGQPKARGSDWAKPIQRAFWAAGVHRWLPGYELAQTDAERRACDAFQVDTPQTRRLGFHTVRRVYVTWLRSQGVDPALRMKLSGHTDFATHMGYDDVDVLEAPEGSLPPIISPLSLDVGIAGAIQSLKTSRADVEALTSVRSGAAALGMRSIAEENSMNTATPLRSPKLKVAGSNPARRASQHSVIVDGATAPANETPPLWTLPTSRLEAWEADQHLQLVLSLRAAALAQGFSRSRDEEVSS